MSVVLPTSSASFPSFLVTSSFLIIESFLLQHGCPDTKWVSKLLLQKVMTQRQGSSWHDQGSLYSSKKLLYSSCLPFSIFLLSSGNSMTERTFCSKMWMSSYGKEKTEKTWNNLTAILKYILSTFMQERNTLSWFTSL